MQTISTNNLFYNKETKCFSQELSSLPFSKFLGWKSVIKVTNPKTGNSQIFNWKKTDVCHSGEDIYGWNFESKEGIKLLIVND